jgi:hypothetical protein
MATILQFAACRACLIIFTDTYAIHSSLTMLESRRATDRPPGIGIKIGNAVSWIICEIT